MSTTHVQSLVEGIILTGIGAVILILIPSQIEEMAGMATQMSPSFFPTVAAIALVILGVVIIVQSFLPSKKLRPSTDISRHALMRVILAALLLIAYTALFQHLGFVVTSGAFFAIFAYLFGSRNVVKILVSMVAMPVVVWLFFEKVFNIPLPHGILF
ncbi:hypothetical protein GF339_09815 [candidate division KSB3 bacterium]|uniref:DUF1468 domain-containing protein n=1 Tax=candidate division KSB3 bacterium TaxID=2044937 RepID=A0A9D5Q5Q2_9BACT|nr:hypothetical protein [candidate division KSB3 bacterium]MBD3324870.1 hypothetical protein [candidate division KSB3 bacterium]